MHVFTCARAHCAFILSLARAHTHTHSLTHSLTQTHTRIRKGGKEEEGEQKATRADEKLQSLRQQKGCQWRHRSERKPLKAERALKTLWDSKKHTAEHACEILAKVVACGHITSQDFARCSLVKDILKSLQKQKTAQHKPSNGGRKPTLFACCPSVGGRCRVPKAAGEWRHSLTGGSFRALVRGLLLLSCCAAPYLGLATAVKTGPSSIATLALPSMQAASSGTLTPPPPRLQFALETSSPYVTSSHVSHHHALEASSPPSVTSRVSNVSCFYVEPAVPSDPPNTHDKLI